MAHGAEGARHHHALHAGLEGRAQQVTRAHDVAAVDLRHLARARGDLGRAVIDPGAAAHRRARGVEIAQVAPDRLDVEPGEGGVAGLGPGEHAHPRALVQQSPHEIRAEMSAGPGDEDRHEPHTLRQPLTARHRFGRVA